MWGNKQCWVAYFVHGEKLDKTLHSNSRGSKMWGNNDVGLHAFVCDEKLDQNITL
jgi:hypothetical protein